MCISAAHSTPSHVSLPNTIDTDTLYNAHLIVPLSFNTLTIRIFSFAFVKSFDFFEPISDNSECCESGVGRMQKFRTDEIRSCKDMKVRGNFVRII